MDQMVKLRAPGRQLSAGRGGRRPVPDQLLRAGKVGPALEPVPAVGRRFAVRPAHLHASAPSCRPATASSWSASTRTRPGGRSARTARRIRRWGCAARTIRSASRRPVSRATSARSCAGTTPIARTTARCLEYQTPALTDGRHALIGMCTPASKIAGTVCVREAQLPGRRGLRPLRRAHEPSHLPGGRGEVARHRVRGGRGMPQRRVLRPRLPRQRRPEPRVLLGRVQREQRLRSDQTCARLVVGNNGTAERSAGRSGRRVLPDAVRRRRRRPACHERRRAASRSRMARMPATSRMASAIARARSPAPPARRETDCPMGGECSIGPRFPGGYCQTFGCDPAATTGVDACPGQQHLRAARRARRADLGVATRSARPGGTACSRASAGYACESVTPAGHRPASAW